MSLLLGLLLLILLGCTAWLDLDQRRIPNTIVAALALLWLPYALHSVPARAPSSLATAAAVLALGMVVWRLRWMGGSDVNLIAALTLRAGAKDTPLLLATIALSGGALALFWRSRLRYVAAWLSAALGARLAAMLPAQRAAAPADLGGPAEAGSALPLPYGVAIAAGGGWRVHRTFIA